MSSQKYFKNGGFPPIKYCSYSEADKKDSSKTSKERFFANAPRQNINIRQLLSDSKKKPIIITDEITDTELEVASSL
jgi:hypothetical protein